MPRKNGNGMEVSRDPLLVLMAPPANESAEEKEVRIRNEKVAIARNAEIEEMLRLERVAAKKRGCIRVLLLGQSESGKSTTLKNFQLAFAPNAFRAERVSWTRIIYLNLVRSINTIIRAVSPELLGTNKSTLSSPSTSTLPSPISPLDRSHADFPLPPTAQSSAMTPSLSSSSQIPIDYTALFADLSALEGLEERLQRQLIPPDEPFPQYPANTNANGGGAGKRYTSHGEFFVYSTTGWKTAFSMLRGRGSLESRSSIDRRASVGADNGGRGGGGGDDVVGVLLEKKRAMIVLWRDERVRRALRRSSRIRLDDSAAFYLDNIDRIVQRYYEPSDDDVIRARLRTVGVQEHIIVHERQLTRDMASEWRMYDVGGTRSERAAWIPYFEHMNAIIFLAPISAFNQVLDEDRDRNRLEDSFGLYKKIVSSKLLAKVQIVLFLNKVDLFRRMINHQGISFSKYVPSYGNRPNEVESIMKYLKAKFKEISRDHSPAARTFFSYFTSVVDTQSTAVTLQIVREGIIRTNLKNADMI
ncbi:G-alpha-domain-containing protein [Sistotremastrum niveocremeum HHB9708]|uniref:G-alpha-domain-containing protein n=1 Tax=Sistotremastrum niveocremeum HHB9708 TaxID=1314777 RepID=A0A164MHY4_9AGAM|nr:G-alpha-domain-containing protein [Sistotremastrum niveocremeum HHB9708]